MSSRPESSRGPRPDLPPPMPPVKSAKSFSGIDTQPQQMKRVSAPYTSRSELMAVRLVTLLDDFKHKIDEDSDMTPGLSHAHSPPQHDSETGMTTTEDSMTHLPALSSSLEPSEGGAELMISSTAAVSSGGLGTSSSSLTTTPPPSGSGTGSGTARSTTATSTATASPGMSSSLPISVVAAGEEDSKEFDDLAESLSWEELKQAFRVLQRENEELKDELDFEKKRTGRLEKQTQRLTSELTLYLESAKIEAGMITPSSVDPRHMSLMNQDSSPGLARVSSAGGNSNSSSSLSRSARASQNNKDADDSATPGFFKQHSADDTLWRGKLGSFWRTLGSGGGRPTSHTTGELPSTDTPPPPSGPAPSTPAGTGISEFPSIPTMESGGIVGTSPEPPQVGPVDEATDLLGVDPPGTVIATVDYDEYDDSDIDMSISTVKSTASEPATTQTVALAAAAPTSVASQSASSSLAPSKPAPRVRRPTEPVPMPAGLRSKKASTMLGDPGSKSGARRTRAATADSSGASVSTKVRGFFRKLQETGPTAAVKTTSLMSGMQSHDRTSSVQALPALSQSVDLYIDEHELDLDDSSLVIEADEVTIVRIDPDTLPQL